MLETIWSDSLVFIFNVKNKKLETVIDYFIKIKQEDWGDGLGLQSMYSS